jgi:predicted nuclease of predicted toxin-antitoxin system
VIIWLDAQLPPILSGWIESTCFIRAIPVRDLGLRDASDREIFFAARDAAAIVMTKDSDFASLLDRLGPPPQLIWITAGNTSNRQLMHLLGSTLHKAIALLESGERLVEIGAQA